MAERPKTAAEIAEEKGELNLTDTYSIVHLRNCVEELRPVIREMQTRLGWIVSSVRLVFNSDAMKGIDDAKLDEVKEKIAELDERALKIGDTLIADYDEN